MKYSYPQVDHNMIYEVHFFNIQAFRYATCKRRWTRHDIVIACMFVSDRMNMQGSSYSHETGSLKLAWMRGKNRLYVFIVVLGG
jgi:hypothetical protein